MQYLHGDRSIQLSMPRLVYGTHPPWTDQLEVLGLRELPASSSGVNGKGDPGCWGRVALSLPSPARRAQEGQTPGGASVGISALHSGQIRGWVIVVRPLTRLLPGSTHSRQRCYMSVKTGDCDAPGPHRM